MGNVFNIPKKIFKKKKTFETQELKVQFLPDEVSNSNILLHLL